MIEVEERRIGMIKRKAHITILDNIRRDELADIPADKEPP